MSCKLITFSLLIMVFCVRGKGQLMPEVWLKAENVIEESSIWPNTGDENIDVTTQSVFARGGLINYNPTVSFASLTDSVLININLQELDELSAFIVFRNDTVDQEKMIWGSTSSTDRKLLISNSNIYDEFNQFSYSFGNTSLALLAGVNKSWEKSVGENRTQIYLGGTNKLMPTRFTGEVAEFLLFDKELSGQEYDIVLSYLGIKYGIGVLQTDYLDHEGNIIWDYEKNESFATGIFGIGRNDALGLYQKQSSNSYGYLSLCVDKFYTTNEENESRLPDNTYLIVSNNGEEPGIDVTMHDDLNIPCSVNKCKWVINSYGQRLNSGVSVTLRVNRFDIFKDSIPELVMVLDESGIGDFSSIKKVLPSSVDENGNLYFSGIEWPGEDPYKAYFSFALLPEIDLDLDYEAAYCEEEPFRIKGTINGFDSTSVYQLTIYGEENELIRSIKPDRPNLEVLIDSVGEYLVELKDRKGNTVKKRTGQSLASYRSPDALNDYYSIYDDAIEIVPNIPVYHNVTSLYWMKNDSIISEDSTIIVDEEGYYALVYNTTSGCHLVQNFWVNDYRVTPPDIDPPSDGSVAEGDGQTNDENDSIANDVDTGIEKNNENSQVILYPNPSYDNAVYLKFNTNKPSEIVIEVYSMEGELLQKTEFKDVCKETIKTTLPGKGIFMIVVKKNSNVVLTSKMVCV